ncbi:GbsR/MarR family transcriptional regulator [Bacillus daqingensis]|uniref:HTH-type transcriptional regulator n=1 Tax=Bacillus daqingensis TaxID=872396 RepID=A0ABV9NS02_9BACI
MDVEEKLEQARARFTNEIANNISLYDLPASIGRLYGTIFFSEDPVTLDELSRKTGMSKTSMSTGVRTLADANMIEKTWRKGVRKDLYQTDPDWYKSFSTVFIKRWSEASELNLKALRTAKAELEDVQQKAGETLAERAQTDIDKLESAEAYYEWLQEVISLFETDKIYELVPKKEVPAKDIEKPFVRKG